MIKQDVFPATVVVAAPDHDTAVEDLRSNPPTPGIAYVQTARVIITEDRILIATEGDGGPQIVFSEGIDSSTHVKYSNLTATDSHVTTLTGKKIAFRKDSACGCGARLKSWRPFNSMSSVKDPTE